MAKNKFPEQADAIERVKAILNLTDQALATEVSVRPETMQKYAAGYQKAGDKLMQIIKRLPETYRQIINGNFGGSGTYEHPSNKEFPRLAYDAARVEQDGRSHDVNLDPPSTQQQLVRVLNDGTLDEVRMVRQVIETVFRQLDRRRASEIRLNRRSPMVFLDGPHRLVPALGYIPAGLPQEALQQANRFIALPAGKFPEADFALKVQGDSMVDVDIHHGDWVMMESTREPRNGSIVAALCDGETSLKTYITDGKGVPYLRSENQAYPPRIIPRDEMQIQGVMIGKMRVPESETQIDE